MKYLVTIKAPGESDQRPPRMPVRAVPGVPLLYNTLLGPTHNLPNALG